MVFPLSQYGWLALAFGSISVRPLLLLLGSLLFAAGCAGPAPMPQAKAGPGVIVGANDRMPRLIYLEDPIYPFDARKEGVTGTVRVEFVIAKDGSVLMTKAVLSPDERLSRAAEAAVLRWKFEPGLKDGKPTACRMQQDVNFELKSASPNQGGQQFR